MINDIMIRDGVGLMQVVKWLVLPDGYWMERCVRHVPAVVRAWLAEPVELPAFIEVRELERYDCVTCLAERERERGKGGGL